MALVQVHGGTFLMANRDEVKGFQPYGRVLSADYYLAGGTIYEGDLVKFDSAGKVVAGTAGAAACGVALQYGVSGDRILVADSPNQKFIGQVAASEVDAQTDINQNASITAGSPNTTYRRSGMEIDGSTLNTTATLEIKLLEIVPRVDNAFGEHVKCVCKINNHQLGSHTGTAGV
jgi:hypothetical protein